MTTQADRWQKHWIVLHELGYGVDDILANGEMGAMRYVVDHTPTKVIMFDVGANEGAYSVLLWELLKEYQRQGTLYAFEPVADTFEKLQSCIDHLPRVEGLDGIALPLAMEREGMHDKTMTIKKVSKHPQNDPCSGLASFHKRKLDHLGIEMEDTETVPCVSLGGFVCDHNIPRIHFLKLDVEGHEYFILHQGYNIWEGNGIYSCAIDYIQFEFGGCNIDSRTYFKDFWTLLSPEFHLYRIVQDGLVLIPEYSEQHEIFLTINYLAISKAQLLEPEVFIRTLP